MTNNKKSFFTQKDFSELIEKSVRKNRMSYMETIIELCEEHDIDISKVGKLVSVNIKSTLKEEATNLNFFERENQLPL